MAINLRSKKVQLQLVTENGYYIKFIKNPDYDVQLVAIQEETNIKKEHFEYIKKYITHPDLLELLEFKILTCEV